MDDLNIDISDKTKDNNNFLSNLRDTFSLQNIITEKTYHEAKSSLKPGSAPEFYML